MDYDFDTIIPRRGAGSTKWEYYPADVLPMWVADMDFRSPEPVIRALRERAEQGTFGYTLPPPRLGSLICERLERLYGWQVTPEQIMYVPSLVVAINLLCRAVGTPGDHVLTLTPAYPPFLSAPGFHDRVCDTLELTREAQGGTLSYRLDLQAFAGALHGRTRLLLLSNPHNPVGLMYDAATLRGIAEACLRNGTLICSDEIHCDLLLSTTRHVPMATLDPEIAAQTITLLSPSKSFNLPGLGCGFMVVPSAEWRARLARASAGIVPYVNAMGYAAALAAYEEGEPWLAALRSYLSANRDFYLRYLREHLPQLRTTVPEATYLGWIDCREAGIEANPYHFFLERARVALSDGTTFGPGGEGFVRLNFGCPRALLAEGLERMRDALEQGKGSEEL
ncbi:MAG: MalY/PatB family protein [Chloroflexaceae bacterium]